ncbi:hypothetical protein FRB95_011749 [Tulasnella sp. JGI-2019a]|nr:hypothetical protein FRB95_011749 [Tulasnella sp. JGI-2019a]
MSASSSKGEDLAQVSHLCGEQIVLDSAETMETLDDDLHDAGETDSSSRTDYATYKSVGKGLVSSAELTNSGRIAISLDLKKSIEDLPECYANSVEEYAIDPTNFTAAPVMNIVIMIVGSRGDVQPFIALGHALQKHGHRVRIATHETFRQMVKDAGLEFYSIGGDPADLMSYMVKNPGLLPGMSSLMSGDIGRKRTMVTTMLNGCWQACLNPDDESGKAFAADAIISNPPTFAHIHCAEALGIPLHMSFMKSRCATTAFPHPLVNVNASNAKKGVTNYLSYAVADLLQWQGLGDVVNKFRKKTLGLAPLTIRSGPSVTDRLKIPWTYCFSGALIPKPKDWVNHIDIVGFYFLEAAKSYQPPEDLLRFLDAGKPPIYIGFGSVVVEDANAMTQTIFDAVNQTRVRAIVSAGWGGLGDSTVPDDIFILPAKPGVPHDWLFTRVFAVCHHGGAGTTAIGLYLGKPTIIVPFFGDQPFWAKMVHKAGAGPGPIPQKKLTADVLAAGIKYCLTETAKEAAAKMGEIIRSEDGAKAGVDSFHAHLPLLNMRCDLDLKRVAVWWSPDYFLKLSGFAAEILVEAKQLSFQQLQPHRTIEYDTSEEATQVSDGGASAVFWAVTHRTAGMVNLIQNPVKMIIRNATALPRGIYHMAESVKDEGVKEAAKGWFHRYQEGLGSRREGFQGDRVRRSGPILGLITSMHPPSKKRELPRTHDTRQLEGREAVAREEDANSAALQLERKRIIHAFEQFKSSLNERRAA